LLESGTATIIFTTGDHFLSERSADLSIEVAMIPGLERPLTPLVNGWAWAISASDPNRRILAAEFLMTLVDGQRLGEWSLQSNFIPARRSALTFWPEDDPYVAFLDEQLSLAQAHPLSNDTTTMTILGNAVFDVISLAKTPQVAAEEAIAGLQE
jgi:ABC-type glycerol-3-phosphate transport system substrate-binding protein